MSDAPTFGEVVDNMGVKPTLNDGDLVADVICIMRVIEPDGDERLSVAFSPNMSWLTRAGMIHTAMAVEDQNHGDA